ncbi:glutaredoxin-like protein [Elsinoe australis]|uniref:Glutaredoxin-like protein n=1 Tax=Elsinoe australis TaxID=40998 RepID=A0A4V6DWX3_9PEZI|nr:glutaredoxin-like protein [Elsinoe australis]
MVRSPSRSRFRPFLILALIILTIIYLTTGSRSTQTSEFYTRTVAAMESRQNALREGIHGALDPAAKAQAEAEAKVRTGEGEFVLPAVKEHGGGKGETVSKEKGQKVMADEDEEGAVEKAKSKAKEVADEVVGTKKGKGKDADEGNGHDADAVHGPKDKGKSVAGRKKVQGKPDGDDGVAKVGNTEKHVKDKTKGKEQVGDHEAEVVLDGILKKSPIIIFSKSYCPFSMKAKRILLQGYKIVPAPHVEELDEHAMGDRLQAALQKMTGRRTVPNILINGKSIGGGDDIEELDETNKLADKILSFGGKRIMEVKKLKRKVEGSS